MEGIEKLRKDIAARYKNLSKDKGVPLNQKLFFYLIEPPGNEQSLSIVYRGNYKMYFNDRIDDRQCEILFTVLLDFAELVGHVDLSYNHLTADSMPVFSKFLQSATNLESLNLQYNEIGSLGGQILFEALEKAREQEDGATALIYLNLEGNRIKSEGLLGITPDEKLFDEKKTRIEGFLRDNHDLLELNLSNNEIDEFGMIELVSLVNSSMNPTSLTSLSIDNPYYSSLTQTTPFHIGRMLQTNDTLLHLSLRKQQINDDGLFVICEHLMENGRLRVLDIGANKFSYKGCISLAQYLKGDECSLESLIMNNNRTGYFGARAMASAITVNKTLVHLDMTTNDINDDGLFLIAKALRKNEILVSVKLFYNHFEQKSVSEFHKLINEENTARSSDWFLDFETNLVDDLPQIAYLESSLPYEIFPTKKYFVNLNLVN